METLNISPCDFNKVVKKLRAFFDSRNFTEMHTQNRLSILAACEDPMNLATYDYAGQVWPLPQTGQMWLEYELLKNPEYTGLYCVSTSYRNEPNPVPGRHDLIFPMFEFEMHGGMEELLALERDLVEFLGFRDQFGKTDYSEGHYENVATAYQAENGELQHEHEARLCDEHGSVFFLKNFPELTSPFWNMARATSPVSGETIARKVDVIIEGVETIGSAERSTDTTQMENDFKNISDGNYAKLLYGHFGKDRVTKELDDFFNLEFFPRSGGGIGLTRLIRAMKLRNLL